MSLVLAAALVGAVAFGAPPQGRLEIGLEPPNPVKGRAEVIRLRFELAGADAAGPGASTTPIVRVSSGRLGPLARAGGPGKWEAEWTPAESPEPEVLGVVAVVPACPLCAEEAAAGEGVFPISAALDLPGESDPGVETRVEVGGRSWGPVRADARGRFVVPVVVPPGARWANATSLNAAGNERRTRLDLRLSEAPGVGCVLWPELLPASGARDVGLRCVTWAAVGAPGDARLVRASTGRGRAVVGEAAGATFQARHAVGVGETEERLRVEVSGAAAGAREYEVLVAKGAPDRIVWETAGEPVPPGGTLSVKAAVVDAGGRVLGAPTGGGSALAGDRLTVPSTADGTHVGLRLEWEQGRGDRPARLYLWRADARWFAAARDAAERPVPGVRLRFASGPEGETDGDGLLRGPSGGESESVVGPEGLLATATAKDRPPPAITVAREVRVALRPAGAFDVEAERDGGWIRWRVRSPEGRPLGGREVLVTSGDVQLGPVERDGEGGRASVLRGTGSVTVTDLSSGASAVVEVR